MTIRNTCNRRLEDIEKRLDRIEQKLDKKLQPKLHPDEPVSGGCSARAGTGRGASGSEEGSGPGGREAH